MGNEAGFTRKDRPYFLCRDNRHNLVVWVSAHRKPDWVAWPIAGDIVHTVLAHAVQSGKAMTTPEMKCKCGRTFRLGVDGVKVGNIAKCDTCAGVVRSTPGGVVIEINGKVVRYEH